jgi:hypothetical protein
MFDAVHAIRKMKVTNEAVSVINTPEISHKGGDTSDYSIHNAIERQPERCEVLNKREVSFDGYDSKFTVFEDSSSVFAGGTGGTLWDSSIALGKYLLQSYSGDKTHQLIALELGSGLGLCSMVASYVGMKVIATERPLAMQLLSHNISSSYHSREITITTLDWTNPQDLDQIFSIYPQIDLVFGSDLVFAANVEVWGYLADIYKSFIDACVGIKIILAYERRERDSLEGFLEVLRGVNLLLFDITSSVLSVTENPLGDLMIFEVRSISSPAAKITSILS